MRAVAAAFPALCVVSLGAAVRGGLADRRDLAARRWRRCCGPGLARVALLQHVTWSVNSLCHLFGARPYATRRYDRATNVWPLALLSLGESWHNGHHSDPTCARHGTSPRQVDISATVIRCVRAPRLGHRRALARPSPPGRPSPLLRTRPPRACRTLKPTI